MAARDDLWLQWVRYLTTEQLREELSRRGLSTAGIVPTLQQRLYRDGAATADRLAGQTSVVRDIPELLPKARVGEEAGNRGVAGPRGNGTRPNSLGQQSAIEEERRDSVGTERRNGERELCVDPTCPIGPPSPANSVRGETNPFEWPPLPREESITRGTGKRDRLNREEARRHPPSGEIPTRAYSASEEMRDMLARMRNFLRLADENADRYERERHARYSAVQREAEEDEERSRHRGSARSTERGEAQRTRQQRSSASVAYEVMRKWGLKFSGARGEDVYEFLGRIEEGRALIPVEDQAVLECLPFFLSGTALHWFLNQQVSWSSWRGFERALCRRFSDPNLQIALRREIDRRTQDPDEPVADYLTCLRGLIAKVRPPWTEQEILTCAHRNMLPRLQVPIHLEYVEDIDHLEELAMRVERSYDLERTYVAPPPPERSLYPNLAFQGRRPTRSRPGATPTYRKKATAFVAAENDRPPKRATERRRGRRSTNNVRTPRPATTVNMTGSMDRASRTKSPVRTEAARPPTAAATEGEAWAGTAISRNPGGCWNCRESGHGYRQCRKVRTIFCYTCGEPNTATPDCARCSGKANEGR